MFTPVLGIDLGISVIKATIFGPDNEERTVARPSPAVYPNQGWVEKDPEEIWQIVVEVVREVIGSRPVDANPVSAIGVCACGNGLIVLDESGRALRPAIFSNDMRAANIAADWNQNLSESVFLRTHQRAYPGQTATLLAWLLEYEPHIFDRIAHVLLLKDYVRYRLTGEIATDPSDLSATNLIPLFGDPDRSLLATLGLERVIDAIPTLRESAAQAGEISIDAASLTGLAAGTPVATGAIDCEAALVGSGIFDETMLSIVAGSWAINQALVAHPPGPQVAQSIRSALPGYFTAIEGSPTSAVNFDWFVNQLFGANKSFVEFSVLAAEVSPSVNRPYFLPFLHGSPAAVGASACFHGLSHADGPAELARAVLEGVVFSHRWHLDRLHAAGLRFRSARLTGGAARSRFWVQLFADTLGLRIEVPTGQEIGARGAALCAGVAVGIWPDLATAQGAHLRIDLCAEPDPDGVALQAERYQRFLQLIEALTPVWTANAKL